MFKFRLDAILRLKEYAEKQRRVELAQCLAAWEQAVGRENELQALILSLEDELKSQKEGTINLPFLLLRQDFLGHNRILLKEQKEVVAQRQGELQDARLRLNQAMRDRKILEKLKEKKYQQYLYEQEKKEQALQDELASQI